MEDILVGVDGFETKKCPFCGGTELISDTARGDVVCGNPDCGEVVEEGVMTNEVQFVQSGSGGVSAAGTRVLWSDSVGGGPCGSITASQDAAISRGMTKISWISDQLHLSAKIQESGRRMYQLSVQMGFNKGRATRFVAFACLYVVCRRNRAPHLLIDFADVLQTPVKVLGKYYMKLLRRLAQLENGSPAANGSPVRSPLPLEAVAQIEKLSAGKFKAEEADGAFSTESAQSDLEDAPCSPANKDDDVEETLDDVKDEELAMYCLDLEEQQHKSDIWHEVNKDYLEEWHVRGVENLRKKKRKAAEMGQAAGKGGKDGRDCSKDGTASVASEGSVSRKSRKSANTQSSPVATTAAHAVAMALTKRGKVRPDRVNLDALESLFA